MKTSLTIPHRGSDFCILVLLLSLGSLTPSTRLLAQELKFKHLSIEDGLSHSKVNCIYQDSRGFMWFGTNEGLNKYNGYEFTIFQREPDNPHSISANLIRCILEDRKGHLWIGTEGGGLNLFDRDLNTFNHFTTDSTSDIRISGNNVNTILEDSRGNLWLGSEKGLDWFDWENKRVINYLPYPPDRHPQLSNEVTVLLEDRHHHLWVGTLGGGLCLFDRDKKTFTYYRHCDTDTYNSGDNEIRSLHEDLQGNLWLGT
ncbi:MAG: histidine kinase, partial [candidate division KSB1 bacterium]|nr:histidine kinase [candidate division KSB1 bacterium]